jgi:hypothetical protein
LLYVATPPGRGRRATIKQHVGRTHEVDADVPISVGSFVAWYFDLRQMGLGFARQFGLLDSNGVDYWFQYQRVRLKFHNLGVRDGAIMAVDDQAAYARVRDLVLDGIRQFGGRGVLFVADDVSEHEVP